MLFRSPLARLGQVSYGVYLFHWPLLQGLRHTSMNPSLIPVVVLSSAITLALASERWLETPIRTGHGSARRLVVVALGSTVTFAAAASTTVLGVVLSVERFGRHALVPAIVVSLTTRLAAGRPGLYTSHH